MQTTQETLEKTFSTQAQCNIGKLPNTFCLICDWLEIVITNKELTKRLSGVL